MRGAVGGASMAMPDEGVEYWEGGEDGGVVLRVSVESSEVAQWLMGVEGVSMMGKGWDRHPYLYLL